MVNNQGLSDPVSEVAKNQKISLLVTKTWWEQKQNGTYYDFVEKVTRPSYDYLQHSETMDKKDLNTDDNGQINYNFDMEKDKSYKVELTAVDSSNRPTTSSSYYYYSDYQNNQNQSSKAYLTIDRDTNLYSIGETVDVKIKKNENDYPKTDKSKFLFILAERGGQEIVETDSPELKFDFTSKYLPEMYVGALLFNGRSYEEVISTCKNGWSCGGYDYYNNDYFFDPLVIRYQKDDSKLDLTISADKTKYLPGDTAHISVHVTKNNSVVADTTVQLTLVDEALAAIGGVREPSISELYKQASNLIYYNYYSHRPVFPDVPQAERGGGGGGRDLFKDTAYFGTIKTDGNGVATFEVKLPDNITNWLTFAQSVTSNLDYGQTKSSVVATKDFFVTSQFPHIVTVKDQPVIAIGTFGNALTEDAKIPLLISVSKDGSEITKNSLTVGSFKENYIDFPRMVPGNYKVTVGGNYKGLTDGITLSSQVIGSRMDFRLTKNNILSAGQTLKSFDGVTTATDKPTKLIIADEGKGKYFYDLYSYCYQNSNRVEKRIASIKANQILNSRFKTTDCNTDLGGLVNFQASDGGIRQVEWGESNLETTLWATYIDPTQFNKQELIHYFETYDRYGSTETVTEKGILKNWGLTLLGKPNVNELNRLAVGSTTYKEKVLAALALYSAGNKEKSKEMYFGILSNYAYTNKPYLRIEADSKKRDYDTFALDTSYALLLGTLNLRDYNTGLDMYLNDYGNQVSTVILGVANMAYIDTILADLPDKDSVISFKTDSQSVNRNISKDGILTLNLAPSEVNNFNLKVTSGKVDATLNYAATSEDFAKLKGDDRLTLNKSVTKVKGDVGTLKIGDILRVDITYGFNDKAPLGCYNVTDYIPSGMTYLENYSNFGLSIGQNGYMYQDGNNKVSGCAYNSKWWNSYTGNRSTYFVRITGSGKFIEEPTIMQSSLDPTVFQKTEADYVKIGQ